MEGQIGTLIYMAPELVSNRTHYTKSIDIFATGIIMFQLLTGGSHPLYRSDDFSTTKYR